MAPSAFRRELRRRQTDPAGRRWLFVPYDQLSGDLGPLATEDPRELGIVVVESPAKAATRPYHKQKLALVLANLRQFALEQAARGVAVRHVVSDGTYADALDDVTGELGVLRVMEPAERELREDLAPLIESGKLETVPHGGWLTTPDQFDRSQRAVPWRMDAFYRLVRRETGILMKDGRPLGGKFSFDADNRQSWSGDPPAPDPPRFEADATTSEVIELVERQFVDHPGELDPGALPATQADAERLWQWGCDSCLPTFGPYEDAMSVQSTGLFHTRVSGLLNLHRLVPRRVIEDVLALDLPLASQEGFIRQILGWREFVRHVHRATDGFRRLPEGYRLRDDGEALPPAFWGSPSGLGCLDTVVASVWREGYSHHITRLMVLCNLATLLDLDPRELNDWFWVAYTDAYDWVVEPNVLGMGAFAVGDLMTTKPYVSGSAYIDRMSDYCRSCEFDPKKSCPITSLYWAYLERHREELAQNPRLRMPYASLRRRAESRRERDGQIFGIVRERLAKGERLRPETFEAD